MPNMTGQASTDPGLLERAKQGDTRAWDRLVAVYQPLVMHWLKRSNLPAADQQDLAQEVLLLVFRKLGDFDPHIPGATFRGWLLTITANKVREFFRREPRRHTVVFNPDAPPEACAAVFERLDREDQEASETQMLKRFMDDVRPGFPERTWKCFWDMVVLGRSAREIGTELGMTPVAVRVAKARVLKRLRDDLQGLGFEGSV